MLFLGTDCDDAGCALDPACGRCPPASWVWQTDFYDVVLPMSANYIQLSLNAIVRSFLNRASVSFAPF
jgi:hypothetical protein